MSGSVLIEGCHVIAAVTPPTSKAVFNRAQLIVRGGDGTIVRVQTYTSEGRAQGPELTEKDVDGLIAVGQATELPGAIPLRSGAFLWVLRRDLPRRDAALSTLRSSGLLVGAPLDGPQDAKLCVVDEGQSKASELRDRWRDEAMESARKHARQGAWAEASVDAEVAQAVSRGLDPDVLAMQCAAYEGCGRTKRATGLLVMARNSRGEDFAAGVVREIASVRNSSARPENAKPRGSSPLRHALSQGRFAALDVGKPMSARLATPAAA